MTCPFCRSKNLRYDSRLQWACLDCGIAFDERSARTSSEFWGESRSRGRRMKHTARYVTAGRRAFMRPDYGGRRTPENEP